MTKKIAVQAVSFCFGPAAIAIALAGELRRLGAGSLNIVGIGHGIAGELLARCDFFSHVVQSYTIDSEVGEILHAADSVVSVCDFDFATNVAKLGIKPLFIDPLLWLWDHVPQEIALCGRYYALDFPGVAARLSKINAPHVRSIPQIALAPYRNTRSTTAPVSRVLINFGGMQSPHGANDLLAAAIVQEAVAACDDLPFINDVKVRCGSRAAAIIQMLAPSASLNLDIGTSSHSEFQKELASCDLLLTAPGMSIVYEALLTRTPVSFLLPLNYSQHRQQVVYRDAFPKTPTFVWESLPGYKTLPALLSEKIGVEHALELGARFYRDCAARRVFKLWLRGVIDGKRQPLANQKSDSATGATCIARDILARSPTLGCTL